MRPSNNDRPVILASALPPVEVSIVKGDRPMILCPELDCNRWVYVRRGLLKPHDGTDTARCPGSGRRVRIDLTQEEHLALLYKIRHAADHRRAKRVHVVPAPPPLPPVCRMGLSTA